MRLAESVQDVADQAAGEHPVMAFGDRAERAGEPEPLGDDLRQLHRCRGDQPHLLSGIEVHLGERAGAGPDLVGDDLVVDLLAERCEFGGGAPGDELQGALLTAAHIGAVLFAGDPELHLFPGDIDQVGGLEVFAGGQTAGEVHDGRALHHGVVHIEERGRGEIARYRRSRLVVKRAREAARNSASCSASAASALASPARLARTSSSLGPNGLRVILVNWSCRPCPQRAGNSRIGPRSIPTASPSNPFRPLSIVPAPVPPPVSANNVHSNAQG